MEDVKSFLKVALSEGRDFVGPPAPIVPFAKWDFYYTKDVVDWEPSDASSGLPSVRVPDGFVTDLASIPKIFWSVLPPQGLYTYPAVVHDYLYWEQPCERDVADQVLKHAMQEVNVSAATLFTIYEAVRAGGARAWASNAALKGAGESRLLKEFPDRITVTWEEWKLDPNHFLP